MRGALERPGFMKRKSYRDDEYLEAILILKERRGEVRVKDLASVLGVKPPSVVEYLEKLAEKGLIVYQKGRGVIDFTDRGLQRAREVFRRHQVLKRLLTLLGVREEVAEEDACSIEHVISDETFVALERLAECLERGGDVVGCLRSPRAS